MSGPAQQFCLRWNNHQSNIISVFEQLLHSEAFVDVTLAVEGVSLKAHKVVLSACSPYFQALLASHQDKHPIVILKDVRYADMRDLLDFMYRGEVSVDQDNLSSFLRVAESLRIKGLTEVNEKKRLEGPSMTRMDGTTPFILSQGSPQGGVSMSSMSSMSSMASVVPHPQDVNTLKRPSMSPTGLSTTGCSPIGAFTSKRRRGRPPKISGEESEGENQHIPTSTRVEGVSSPMGGRVGVRGEGGEDEEKMDIKCKEVKMEAEEVTREDGTDNTKDSDRRSSDSAGPSSDIQTKDDLKIPKEEPDHTRESPGSGGGIKVEWTPSEYDHEEINRRPPSGLGLHPTSLTSSLLQHPPKIHPHHYSPPVTTIDQLYYTKNLLEAAMLKNPYEALKGDKHLHGSILLASLRSPLKFGLGGYGERDFLDRDFLDPPLLSAPLSPRHITSTPKPSQSYPNSVSPSSGSNNITTSNNNNNNNNNTNSNGKGVSVPIMSYCIQDNGFKCSKCFQTFTHPSNFHRHYITVHTDRRAHKCHVCGKEFKRKDNMMSHIRSVHRPGKEGHSIFRDVSAVSPTLAQDLSPIHDQLLQQVDKV